MSLFGRVFRPIVRSISARIGAKRDTSDLTHSYNTSLGPREEFAYRRWARSQGYHPNRDTYDYDLRGAWKANLSQDARGHLSDEFKKPNHPTFSTESIYAKEVPGAGRWEQHPDKSYTFHAGPANLVHNSAEGLQHYFATKEAGNKLNLAGAVQPGAAQGGSVASEERGAKSRRLIEDLPLKKRKKRKKNPRSIMD